MAKPTQSERNRKMIPLVPGGTEPMIPRKRLMLGLVQQVNHNTRKLLGPLPKEDETLVDQGLNNESAVQKQSDSSSADTGIGTGNDFDSELADGVVINLLFDEILRRTSTIRVENPEDSNQYVDVERIDRVLMVNKAGQYLGLRFDNPTT